MSITSVGFLLFISIVFILYFIVPAKYQWVVLLLASLYFYFISVPFFTFIYIIITVLSVYFATKQFESRSNNKKTVLVCTIILNIGMLAVLKYSGIAFDIVYYFTKVKITELNFIVPLAISFYTLQIVSYTLDCYWGIVKPEKNIFKLLLYTIYFPQMTSGPISRYSDLGRSIFDTHKFEYDRFVIGLRRIGFGMVKKLLIATRLRIAADPFFNDPNAFSGIWIWVGMAFFTFELYADFSGCMDIVIGLSICLGIHMEENFNAPLMSKTVKEFWQRWHITLGTWLRDYIMNPLLKSNIFIKIGEKSKKIFGKKTVLGKNFTLYLAMLAVWVCMGIWHGNDIKYVVGEGIWFWIILVLGNIVEFYSRKKTYKFVNSKLWNIFKIARTFILVSIGLVFFRATSVEAAINMLKLGFMKHKSLNILHMLIEHGVGTSTLGGYVVVIWFLISVIMCVLCDWFIYKGINPFQEIREKSVVIRFTVYWFIVIGIILTIYGEQTDFIYAGF